MDRNLEQCRKELDQMKKELHELIDMAINLAMSLYELPAKMHVHGQGAMAGAPGSASVRAVTPGWVVVAAARARSGTTASTAIPPKWLANSSNSIISFGRGRPATKPDCPLAAQLRALRDQGHNQGQQGNPQSQRQGQGDKNQPQPQRGEQGNSSGSQSQQGGESGQCSSIETGRRVAGGLHLLAKAQVDSRTTLAEVAQGFPSQLTRQAVVNNDPAG